MTQLSENFSFAELTRTSQPFDNSLHDPGLISALTLTAAQMEKVRTALGDLPVVVTSGYRSPEVNKAVGGVPNSQHLYCEAVDFVVPQFGIPEKIVAKLKPLMAELEIDQLLLEATWVHVSFCTYHHNQPRNQFLDLR